MTKSGNCLPFLGYSAMIMPQKPAQTGVTFNFVRIWRTGTKWGERNDADGLVLDSLMRSDGVVICFVFSDHHSGY